MTPSSPPRSVPFERARQAPSGADSGFDFSAWLGGGAVLEPLVGVVWQRALGECLGIRVELHCSFLLGLSLWLVYIADRWLDARVLSPDAPCTARHRFTRAHHRLLAVTWVAVLVLDLALAVFTLNGVEWLTRLGLLAATVGYFWGVHSRIAAAPKELLVTAIYSAGISVFAWPALGWIWNWTLPATLAVVGFALLALLNLTTIALSEAELDHAQGFPSLQRGGQRLTQLVEVGGIALALTACAGAVVGGPFQPWFAAIFGSALVLLLLGRLRSRLHPDHLHLAADTALLVPLLLSWS